MSDAIAFKMEISDDDKADALEYLTDAETRAGDIDGLADAYEPAEIKQAGVIGLGTMGQGIALVLARAGINVIGVEIEQARVDAGLENIAKGLKDRVSRGRMTEAAMNEELARISGATDFNALSDADIVIEAALEDMSVKTDIFSRLDAACKPETILASNTSSLDMDMIAKTTRRPEKVAGAHFFAPAQVMKLLEVVKGAQSAPETIASLMALGKRIGKVGVAVGNGPGFVGNRMYHRYTWQAYFLLQEGAFPEDVDQAMQAFGFPLGCLAVGDISGLDVAWQVRKAQMASGDIDPSAPYPVVADRMCDQGWFGRKTGRGWYQYETGKPVADPEVHKLIEDVSSELGINRRAISADEIRERCLFALINEGARLLGNGMAARASDIDVVWRYGYGFPTSRGGPMYMAENMGLGPVLTTLERLQHAHGAAFEPAPLIVEYVKAGKQTFSG